MIALLMALALAQEEHAFKHAWGDGWSVDTSGQLRYLGVLPGDLPLDTEGHRPGQGFVLDQRLRAGLGLQFKGLRLATEWDLFSGQLAGDTWDLEGGVDARHRDRYDARTLDGFIPRRASFTASHPWGAVFEGGIVPARWGLGILANNGTRESLFGRLDRGDRMLRFRTSFAPFHRDGKPLPLFATLAVDQVIEDDLARWADGQRAGQLVASLLYTRPAGPSLGLFYTFRYQLEQDDQQPTAAHVLDLYGELPVAIGESWSGRFAFEAAGIVGRTERVLTYAHPEQTRIESGALAVEAEIHAPADRAVFHLRGGVGSASGDPDSGQLHDFTFDSNYNVGMVLFDEVMGGIEAGTYQLLIDRENAGRPPLGADLLVSEGAVRRATWLQPAVVVHPYGPLDLRLGMVAAWSTGPISQAFYTYRAGGQPHNQLDQPTRGHWMGAELDWAVGLGRADTWKSWWFRPRFVIEGGHAFLGENLGGGVVTSIIGTARVDW